MSRSHRLQVNLTEEEFEYLQSEARLNKCSISALIVRRAVAGRHLKAAVAPPPPKPLIQHPVSL